MISRVVAGILAAFLSAGAPVAALVPASQTAGEPIEIVFDPPVDGPTRYRWEKSVEKDGRTDSHWSIDKFSFEEVPDGFRLQVKPESWGSNESDPEKLELEKMLSDLTDMPFVLRLSDKAEIVELERSDELWTIITSALRKALDQKFTKKPDEDGRKAVLAVLKIYEDMPENVRLAKLSEPVQPILEFANTAFTVGEAVPVKLEIESPFGGTVSQDVVVSLRKIADGVAHFTIRASVPRAEFDKLMGAFMDRMAGSAMSEDKAKAAKAQLAKLRDFRMETVSDYQVSMDDGLLLSYFSTETIAVTGPDGTETRRTMRSMKRLD